MRREWRITYVPSGTTSISGTGTDGKPYSSVIPWDRDNYLRNGYPTSVYYPATMDKYCSGVIAALLTWYASDNAPPPKKVYLLESQFASWLAYGSNYSGYASNSVNPEKPSYSGVPPFQTVVGGGSSGNRLRQYDGSSGSITVVSPLLNSRAQAAPVAQLSATLHTSTGFSVKDDPRSVSLLAPAFHSPDGNWAFDGQGRVQNKANSDGSWIVDSVPTYTPYLDGGTRVNPFPWRFSLGVTAYPTGFPTDYSANVRVDWSSSGLGRVSNTVFQKWDTTLTSKSSFGDYDLTDDRIPGSSTVVVKVTDQRPNLEATAENTYTIRWHRLYENWQPNGTMKTLLNEQLVSAVAPGYAMNHGTIRCTWLEYQYYEAAWSENFATLLGVISSFPSNTALGTLLSALGVAAGQLAPTPQEGSASFDGCWKAQYSTVSGGTWDEQARTMGRYTMAPRLYVPFNATRYRAEAYVTNGFSGFQYQAIAKRLGPGTWAGDFVLTGGPQ